MYCVALAGDAEREISNTETLHFAAYLILNDVCRWLIEDKGRISDLDKVSCIGNPLYLSLTAGVFMLLPRSDIREHDKIMLFEETKQRTLEYLLDAGASMENRVHPTIDQSLLALALEGDFGWRSLLIRGVALDDSALEMVEELRSDGRSSLGEQFLSEISDQNLDENIRLK